MSYACPVCGSSIEKWIANRDSFECEECKSLLTSNRKKILKQSLAVALVVWIFVLLVVKHYSDSWGYAVVVSIEAGGFLAAMIAALYYRLAIRLIRVHQ